MVSEDLALDLKKQDLKQLPSVRSNHTAEASSNAIGQTHQSMVTSSNSPENSSEQMELFQTLSSADTPVSPSPSQVVKEAKKTKDISGQKCIDLYESCGHDGSFARMLVDTLNSVSTKYYLHWRLKDTPSGRLLFQRAVSTRPTKETGSGLWLTPTAVMIDETPEQFAKRKEKNGYKNGTKVGSLATQVKHAPLWPTPTAMTGGGSVAPSHRDGTHGWNTAAAVKDSLSEEPIRMWPTPTIDSATERTKKYSQGGTPLPMAAKMWPTARASDHKGAPKNRHMGSETYRRHLSEAARTSETDGQLNPTWVEWLMCFPIDHTELKHWATRSSRKSQKQSD